MENQFSLRGRESAVQPILPFTMLTEQGLSSFQYFCTCLGVGDFEFGQDGLGIFLFENEAIVGDFVAKLRFVFLGHSQACRIGSMLRFGGQFGVWIYFWGI
jgi:hypothetical protein